jgi:hypothetical protein
VNANSAFAAAAFRLHLGSQIPDVDAKLRRALSASSSSRASGSSSPNDPRHHAPTLENANLEHIAAVVQPLGRTVQRVANNLPQLAARIT